MELRDYWKIFKKRLKLIITTTIIVVISYIFFITTRKDQYVAFSTVMVNPPSVEQYLASRLLPGAPVAVIMPQNQLEMMNSWGMAQKVSDEIKEKEGIKISPEEVYRSRKITLEERTIIRINVTSDSGKKAKLIADYYADISVEENRARSTEEYKRGIHFIEKKMEEYKNRAEKVEEDIRNFNKEFSSVDFSSDILARINRLSNYTAEKEKVEIQKEETKRIIVQLREQLEQEGQTITTQDKILNPELANYKAQLYTLELELMNLQDYYTDQHPKVIAQKEKIDILNRRIRTNIAKFLDVEKEIENPRYTYLTQSLINKEMELISFDVREDALQEIIKKEQDTLQELSDEEMQYAKLLKDKQVAEKQYSTLQDMIEAMRVNEATASGNAQVLDKSPKARKIPRTSPQQFLFVFVIGFFVALFLGVSLEFLDDTIKTPYEVKRYLNLTTLGTIPKIKEYDLRLIYNLSPKSPVTEIYNKIAYHLQKICLDTSSKSIVITSAKLEEGKTTIISNLALALSQTGENVILVDADLRKPSVHRIFNISNAYGLTSLITGEALASIELQKIQLGEKGTRITKEEVISRVIQKNGKWNLSILTAGPLYQNPIEILTKSEMQDIIEYLKRNYTKALFDSPPILSVIDSAILSSYLDGVIIVLDGSSIKRGEAIKVKQTLTNLKAKIFGVILNNCDMETEEYYYYYQYHLGSKRYR